MVYRIYSEKRPEFSEAAEGLAKDIREFLGIRTLEGVRIINRYDAEGVDEATFNACIETVFSEPQVDRTYTEAEFRAEICGNAAGAKVFAVEYLPGQFDQRADSAAQCISLVAQCERPTVRSAAFCGADRMQHAECGRIFPRSSVHKASACKDQCERRWNPPWAAAGISPAVRQRGTPSPSGIGGTRRRRRPGRSPGTRTAAGPLPAGS